MNDEYMSDFFFLNKKKQTKKTEKKGRMKPSSVGDEKKITNYSLQIHETTS